ncbi:MAG: UvrD-helicase domain-containing protein [Deltaproteobacteria bacterium]|jgi:DNA helicase-2/ATP-dependent DNA helicase PcrA|nr:UvrD-helicase domain-containing protein [Deltaproteobacteria bacterium]
MRAIPGIPDDAFFADLHIHSRFSRATSKGLNPASLHASGKAKGLALLGSGDMTHPGWLKELKESLEPHDSGFYRLKGAPDGPLFVPTGEVSCIYKQDGKTRRIHLVFVAPDLEAAARFSGALAVRGNVASDGRPIMGMSARDVLELALTADAGMAVIPAHVWTPWFSLFGSMSGFDRLEDCFRDLSGHIKCLETGLSSDPAMNRLLSSLDGYALVSSSDAHSPDKLGRESTIIKGPPERGALWRALAGGPGLLGTVEFFPEEGKYHLDGHSACGAVFSPEETKAMDGLCPICGRPLTVGVLSRVMQLADRSEPPEGSLLPDFHVLPLAELLGQVLGQGPSTKAVLEARARLVRAFGSEYSLLLSAPLDEIAERGSPLLSLGVARMRRQEVEALGGYDGVFGTISVINDGDRREHDPRGRLFGDVLGTAPSRGRRPREAPAAIAGAGVREARDPGTDTPTAPKGTKTGSLGGPATALAGDAARDSFPLNESQLEAVTKRCRTLCVVAGPGSGKTKVLVARALWYLSEGVDPLGLLLTTFTRKAAQSIKERLLSERADTALVRVSTLHALAHRLLLEEGAPGVRLAPEDFLEGLAKKLTKGLGLSPRRFLQLVSRGKNLMRPVGQAVPGFASAMSAYQEALSQEGLLDFDDLVGRALPVAAKSKGRYKAVLADECQDLSPLEWFFLSALSDGADLTLIGDPAQRVYGFKGALPSFEESVLKDRPGAIVLRLGVNYRSTRLLTKASDALRRPRDGAAQNAASEEEGKHIVRACLASPASEAWYVVKRIKAHLGDLFLGGGASQGRAEPGSRLEGLTFGDIAIVYRLRIQGEEILKAMVEEGLPCQISGEDEVGAQDGLDLKADKISLLTMHASKGLEFRLVFVTGLEDGIIPVGPWYDGEPEQGQGERLSEEGRLFYVAITRAKEQLYLTRAKRRRVFGSFLSGEPSPFWGMVPSDLVMDLRPGGPKKPKPNTLF